MNTTDLFEITFNEKTEKFALWMNGKIIKMAANESTLEKEVENRGGEL